LRGVIYRRTKKICKEDALKGDQKGGEGNAQPSITERGSKVVGGGKEKALA